MLAHRASAPHVEPRHAALHELRVGDHDVLHYGPQESNELARDGHHRDLRPLPIRERVEPCMQPVLRFHRVRDHRGRLSLLPTLQVHAGLRPVPIAPRRLNEDMPAVGISRLGDCAQANAIRPPDASLCTRATTPVRRSAVWKGSCDGDFASALLFSCAAEFQQSAYNPCSTYVPAGTRSRGITHG